MSAKTDFSKILPFKFWANVAQFESNNNIKMEVFLEQISQRIPFMGNVLADIAKNTPQDTADYVALEGVYGRIKKLSDKILTLKEIAHQRHDEPEHLVKTKTQNRMANMRKALTIGAEKNKSVTMNAEKNKKNK